MAASMTHANPMQQIVDTYGNITSWFSPQHQRERDVLLSRQPVNEMKGLEYDPDCFTPHRRPILTIQRVRGPSINLDVPRRGVIQSGDKIEEGALPAPTRTDKSTEFALPNLKVYAVQGRYHRLTAEVGF
jgi:hypothetical protein